MAVMSNKRTLYLAFGCVMPEIKGRLRDHVGYIIGRLRDETMRHRASKHKDLVMKTFARSWVCFFFSFLSYVTCFFFDLPLFSVTPQSIYIIEAHGEDGYG